MSAKRPPKIRTGRNLMVFYFRKNLGAVTAGAVDRKTDTGTMKISSAALTALDLLRYPQASGAFAPEPQRCDPRLRVIARRVPESDG